MYIDPTIVSWLLIAGASVCAFMIGRGFNNLSKEEIVNDTIIYLIENNFVKAKEVNGEWEILDLDDQE